MDKKKITNGALWLWVLCGFAIYMAQFRDFIGPTLNVLGIR
jgi:hypothetical protein